MSRVLLISRAVRDCTLTVELNLLMYALFMLMVDFFNSSSDAPMRLLGVCGMCASYEDFYLSLSRYP